MWVKMKKRFVAIYFPYLVTDWLALRRADLVNLPFGTGTSDHGRLVLASLNAWAAQLGLYKGMSVADARALLPVFEVIEHKPGIESKLLQGIAEWAIRYSPVVSIDTPDGLILDASGCAHLWGGEEPYINDITTRLKNLGYQVRVSMADTIGTAWAVSRFAKETSIIAAEKQFDALLPLPPAALRIEQSAQERLQKLGLYTIRDFISLPRSTLRRRFGEYLLQRLNQALGQESEFIVSVQPDMPYQDRLPCLEPIVTAKGIEIAVAQLLHTTCARLANEGKGIRQAILKCFRVDGKIETVEIGTSRATHHEQHLYKLFELKLPAIEPALGIELFLLEVLKADKVITVQEQLWQQSAGLDNPSIAELIDRISGRIGVGRIRRYLPAEHYLPEHAFQLAATLSQQPSVPWKVDTPRPLQLLATPEKISVTAPIPDYPPMNFRYKGVLHKVIRADGPERMEQEWWIKEGEHRDYYAVENEQGARYWIFRLGHYRETKSAEWFLHGFFA